MLGPTQKRGGMRGSLRQARVYVAVLTTAMATSIVAPCLGRLPGANPPGADTTRAFVRCPPSFFARYSMSFTSSHPCMRVYDAPTDERCRNAIVTGQRQEGAASCGTGSWSWQSF